MIIVTLRSEARVARGVYGKRKWIVNYSKTTYKGKEERAHDSRRSEACRSDHCR